MLKQKNRKASTKLQEQYRKQTTRKKDRYIIYAGEKILVDQRINPKEWKKNFPDWDLKEYLQINNELRKKKNENNENL